MKRWLPVHHLEHDAVSRCIGPNKTIGADDNVLGLIPGATGPVESLKNTGVNGREAVDHALIQLVACIVVGRGHRDGRSNLSDRWQNAGERQAFLTEAVGRYLAQG